MIGPIVNFDDIGGILTTLLTYYLPIVALSLALAGAAAWWLARTFALRLEVPAGPHSWLSRFPITPLLAFGAFLLPFFEPSFLAALIALTLLILPVAAVWGIRYYKVEAADSLRLQINRRAVLRIGWKDTGLVSVTFFISAALYAVLTPSSKETAAAHLPNLLPGFVFGGILGIAIGLALSFIRRRLTAYLDARHRREQYHILVEGLLRNVLAGIEALLTQFHGTPLAMVLAILTAGLPYTTANQTVALPLLMFAPLASAILAASMVDDPASNQPGIWHHMRQGISNVAQIGLGYMIGAILLAPLDLVYQWISDQPSEVNGALIAHLELTFIALAYSLVLGILGGILSSRVKALRVILTNLGNLGRTLPSLAVLALALPLFSSLNTWVENTPAVREILMRLGIEEIEAVGRNPSLVALVFIGVLPILINTTVGIVEVSEGIKEAARGMGMNDLQVLMRAEIPVAMPVIMAGVRTSAVLVVASATLAGFIGGGGLGALIIRGDGSGRDDILFTGAILATVLSIFLEYFFGWLETLLTPRGLREA